MYTVLSREGRDEHRIRSWRQYSDDCIDEEGGKVCDTEHDLDRVWQTNFSLREFVPIELAGEGKEMDMCFVCND